MYLLIVNLYPPFSTSWRAGFVFVWPLAVCYLPAKQILIFINILSIKICKPCFGGFVKLLAVSHLPHNIIFVP